ncbi:Cytochrome P450 78A9 [Camellia lanceoleosa]|uniref:Cytochrome P450 78A9 n=1 Tax=Camellia lanceoleosa TaxID=1840588 RepID=A0ACC0IX12_9ERIC|nr:Cytochrome P450 78A9 [Camellia lanceoleosa]
MSVQRTASYRRRLAMRRLRGQPRRYTSYCTSAIRRWRERFLKCSVFADRPVKEFGLQSYKCSIERIGFAPYGVYWRTLSSNSRQSSLLSGNNQSHRITVPEIADQMAARSVEYPEIFQCFATHSACFSN